MFNSSGAYPDLNYDLLSTPASRDFNWTEVTVDGEDTTVHFKSEVDEDDEIFVKSENCSQATSIVTCGASFW